MPNESPIAEPTTLRLKPTMIIGLGGTGKEVLLRIRRLFYERKGRNLDGSIGYPIIGYLLVDTDATKIDKIAKEPLSAFVSQNIRLGVASGVPEFIHCKVDGPEFNKYFAGGKTYPHIARWLDPAFNRHGAVGITDGAGQNRPFGRLAFFHHYRAMAQRPGIRDTIDARIREILSKAKLPNLVERWREQGTAVDADNLEVILVYSLAGGTGAGMFLDMGMLVRSIVDEMAIPGLQPHYTHIAVLPEVFVNKSYDDLEGPPIQVQTMKEKIQENAFAALREMEYFAMRRGKDFDLTAPPPVPDQPLTTSIPPLYVAEWEEGERIAIQDAPWDTCYLVGASNDTTGGAFVPSNEIFQMISEYIFLDFDPSEFGANKRGLRSNQQDVTLQVYEDEIREADGRALYRRPLSRRFRLFGLSQIYFDRARMRRAAAYRLAERLITEHWHRDPGLSPTEMSVVAKRDLIGGVDREPTVVTRTEGDAASQVRLSWEAVRDRLLAMEDGADSKSWLDLLQEESEILRDRLNSGGISGKEKAAIADWLARHDVRLNRGKATAGETGLAVRSFEERQDRLQAEIDHRVKALFLDRVEQFGVIGAAALLNEYDVLVGKEVSKAEAFATKTAKLEDQQWRARLDEAAELPLANYARTAIRAVAVRAISGVRKFLGWRYIKAVAPLGRDSLEHFVRQVSIRSQEANPSPSYARSLTRFESAFAPGLSVDKYLKERFEEHRVQGGTAARTVPLMSNLREDEYDSLIRQSPRIVTLNRGSRPGVMNWPAIESAILEVLRGDGERWRDVRSLGHLILRICRPTETSPPMLAEEFAGALAEACDALLEGFAVSKTALAQFFAEPSAKQSHYLELLRTYSAPYLRYARLNQGRAADAHLDVYLGADSRSDPEEARRFRNDVVNPSRPSTQQSALTLLQSFDMKDDALVLYQEKVGIPICYYQGLEELGRRYDASSRIKEAHFDFPAIHHRLPEIRMADHSKQHIIGEMLQCTLLGIMTRRIRQLDDSYTISRDRGAGELKTSVGKQFQDVVRYLVADDNERDRDRLLVQVNDWLQAADTGDGNELAALWCGLQDFYEEVRRRVQYMLDSDPRLRDGLVGDHPLMLVLWERMIPKIRERLERHPSGARFLTSELDWTSVASNDRIEPLEKKRRLAEWRDAVKSCFEGRAEGLIPVLRPNAAPYLVLAGYSEHDSNGHASGGRGLVGDGPRLL